ncbi:MAG: matrixin family metalloprotease [Planctomycetota bacterium]|nr:matrixin family metalloprotease [Planctomycetota bacterium]
MKLHHLLLPSLALGAGALLTATAPDAAGYNLLGFSLDLNQRDFRVFNNFSDPSANNNQDLDDNFPGYRGAIMAIWKAHVEWQSVAHGTGDGDSTQPGGLGSGSANFDPSFQGESPLPGGIDENIHSEISGCSGGLYAFTEQPDADGWRVRYYACVAWADGPDGQLNPGEIDLQGVACHQAGHAAGLGHSVDHDASMYAVVTGTGVSLRSIESDDRSGIMAAYGSAGANKPRIDQVIVVGDVLTVNGAHFSPNDNQIWFTRGGPGGDGYPVKATGLPSNGLQLTCIIPPEAGKGDILVRRGATAHQDLSAAHPSYLAETCFDPTSYCTTTPNSVGPGAIMSSRNMPSSTEQLFTLEVDGGPPNQFGIFYYGTDQIATPYGEGVRCVGGGNLGVFRLPVLNFDPFGMVGLMVDWNVIPVGGGPGEWFTGDTWYVQFWYRDPTGGPSGFNFSDALSLTVCH